jgi:hypothetical protein
MSMNDVSDVCDDNGDEINTLLTLEFAMSFFFLDNKLKLLRIELYSYCTFLDNSL